MKEDVENPRWLLFRTGKFDPLERRPQLPTIGPYDLTAAAYSPGARRYYIVQFTGPIRPAWSEALRETGAEALEYLPNNAYLVRIDETKRTRLDSLPNVRWVGDFEPGYKIEPSLAQLIESRSTGEEVLLQVATFRGASAEPLRSIILGSGPSATIRHLSDTVLGEGRIILSVKVEALGALIATLASHPDVEWIEEYHPPQLLNDDSLWVIQSGNAVSEATPIWDHGITGVGQIFGIADSGLDTDACQMRFSSAASAQTLFNTTQPPNVNVTNPGNKIQTYYRVGTAEAYDDTANGFHGTHTTGNAVGDNFASLATATNPAHDVGDGMAPAAKVVFQDIGRHDVPGQVPGPQTDLQQQAYDSGARIHNNSYGASGNSYTVDSRDLDEVMWRLRHYTIFFSAGNNGPVPGGLGLYGSTAKNTLSVGATVNGSQGADDLASFSSHGPTSDGRFKPDLMAPGEAINSATEDAPVGGQSQTNPPNNNCATSPASGTSFASPTLAGAGLLVRQYFTDGFYPSGVKTPGDAFDPSNALVKAALINSGRNLTGQFTASDGTGGVSGALPNFGQGWGRVTLDASLFFPGDLRELRVLNDVLNGETTVVSPAVTTAIQTTELHEFTLGNVSTIEDLRVTLNWSDPAGRVGSGVVLVNNLNLEVVDPNGVLYKGNVNFVNGFSTPAGATPADNLNTTENIYIKDPPSGNYTVRVRGANVPGNGTTTPFNSNRQGYAVIATGNFSFGNGPLVRFDSVTITGGKNDDAFLDRTEALNAAVTVRNHGATNTLGSTVSLSVDPASEVPASAVVISPPSITYGTVLSKATATDTFSIALVNGVTDFSNQRLRIKVDATASGAPTTSEVFAIETMADTATTPLFNGFESGLIGWTRVMGTGPNPGPGLVTCETSGARSTPLTELKFGQLDCASSYLNNQVQIATSPSFTVPLANNTQLVSLNFWHRLGTESFFDFAVVLLDHNNDGIFDFIIDDFNGPDMGQMRQFRADLGTTFNTGRTGNMFLRFALLTDAFVTAFPGWFVDDVSITTKSADPVADTTPALIAASPSTGAQGTVSLNVAITGLNTHFVNGVSTVSVSGTGITVNSTTVTNLTQLTANITIGSGATLGTRTITVTTGGEVATRAILFRVVPLEVVFGVSVSPTSWAIGAIPPGTTTRMSEANDITATNTGNVAETMTLRIANPGTAWAPGLGAGTESFHLQGLFVGSTDAPLPSDFQADDTLFSGAPVGATATQFGMASGGPGFHPDASGSLMNNLVAYWKLDEASGTRFDAVGTNHLTDNNTVTQSDGKAGTAAHFTQANSEYLEIADNTDLSLGDVDFTIAGWVYLDSPSSDSVPFAKWGDAYNTTKEWGVVRTGSVNRFEFRVSGNGTTTTQVTADSFGAPPAATWIFIVAWHDSVANTINIQINNGTVDSAAHTTGVYNGTIPFRIGTNATAPISFWDGRIDEVGFWKRVLTPQERADLYQGGLGNTLGAGGTNGVGVPPGGTRDLWLSFTGPTQTTQTNQESIVVEVGAAQTP